MIPAQFSKGKEKVEYRRTNRLGVFEVSPLDRELPILVPNFDGHARG